MMECSETVTRALLEELEESFQRESEIERFCHQSEMLCRVEQTTGIFFAREDN